ncbi:MAG: hypothetical protein EZS28_020250 [Streblomastix strix]|uniref:Uncharacterized protein n=1 Tax=Streblomastix strix TaxID=222440 RepID=A0A5J4VNU4_9EUKA|nr:MAG: hypothetical protein EZS28_020250 [Streblomastix strix]
MEQLDNQYKNRLQSSQLYWLNQSKTIATVENIANVTLSIKKLAWIDDSYSITSKRSASITNAITQWATMEEINRMSKHKDGPKTVQVFYDKNQNDEFRERLGSFQ